MTDIIIQSEAIGKRYRIHTGRPQYATLREELMRVARLPLSTVRRLRARAGGGRDATKTEFWALRDISFEIPRGQVVGVIGRNGAGKTTLLKILSRITEPTEGSATVSGRVGSLLEVGTGFHPELTGRENIFLSAAILGMTHREATASFDRIVAFAGVERFIDTPLKFYSSGMYLRLAFAVAAHLETDILFIDEVLAVGDLEFQKRCIGRMQEVSREGRTILFVSHNMAAIEAICDSTMVLEAGRLNFLGPTRDAIKRYTVHSRKATSDVSLVDHPGRHGTVTQPLLMRLRLSDVSEQPCAVFSMSSDIVFDLSIRPPEPIRAPYIGFGISNWTGQRLCTLNSRQQHPEELELGGECVVRCVLHDCLLLPGQYTVEVWIKQSGQILDAVRDAVTFEVVAADIHGTGKVQTQVGVFEARATWSLNTSSERSNLNAQI